MAATVLEVHVVMNGSMKSNDHKCTASSYSSLCGLRRAMAMEKRLPTLAFCKKGSTAARLLQMVPAKLLRLGDDLTMHAELNA